MPLVVHISLWLLLSLVLSTKGLGTTELTSPQVVIRIAAVGDIMLGTDFPEEPLPPDDGRGQLLAALPFLWSADLSFGNLEGTLTTCSEPGKDCRNPENCYLFRSPPHYARTLADAGFTVLSLANNHARDFGEEGRDETMEALDEVGLRHSGAEGDVASWIHEGKRIALIAYSPFKGSWPMMETEFARATVSNLAEQHDLVLVSVHGGCEGADAGHVIFGDEHCYGEERGDVVEFAHAVIEAGADLVLGHGPHVPRAIELYQQRLIAYSLGNFATWFGLNISGRNGLAPLLMADLDQEGRFQGGRIVSFRQHRPGGPRLDPTHAAAKEIARLTAADFPDGKLQVDENGRIEVTE